MLVWVWVGFGFGCWFVLAVWFSFWFGWFGLVWVGVVVFFVVQCFVGFG